MTEIAEYDAEYGDFVCRMLELQKCLDERLGVYENPRSIDSFYYQKRWHAMVPNTKYIILQILVVDAD